MTEQIEIEDQWAVVDRWWTDQPQRRYFASISEPGGSRACVRFDGETGEWLIADEDDVAHFVSATRAG